MGGKYPLNGGGMSAREIPCQHRIEWYICVSPFYSSNIKTPESLVLCDQHIDKLLLADNLDSPFFGLFIF